MLGDESNKGDHCEASVLDLLELLLLRVLVQEVKSRVDLLVLGGLSTGSLSSSHSNHLNEGDLGEVKGDLGTKVGGLSSSDSPGGGRVPVTESEELRGKGTSGTEPEGKRCQRYIEENDASTHMAHRPWMTSASWKRSREAGSFPKLRGSNPYDLRVKWSDYRPNQRGDARNSHSQKSSSPLSVAHPTIESGR